MAHLLTPDARFWCGKRVFLTGHTGFKGAWLTLWLTQLGATVMGYALPADTSPNLSNLVAATGVQEVHADIRDGARLTAELVAFAPDVVLHLAAQSLVQRSYLEPVSTIETNVMGTVHVLEALRRTKSVRCAVIVTSDKCYQNREWLWAYREDEPLGGVDPYSSSKACAELVTLAWRHSFLQGDGGIAVASARAGNVIGGGDWAENRLIPDCVRALSAGGQIRIRNPAAVRPWQHVLEPLSGYLLLAESLWRDGASVAEAWNFGPAPDDMVPVSDIADQVVALWGDGAAWKTVAAEQGHEAGLLAVDATKARARLGWRPCLGLAEALAWTISWYKRYAEGVPAATLVLDDIARYSRRGAVR